MLKSGRLGGEKTADRFQSYVFRAMGVFLLYGGAFLMHPRNLAVAFLSLGALVVGYRLFMLWTRLRRPDPGAPSTRSWVSTLAADLVFLIVLRYGLIQTRIELDRGNVLGAILTLTLVTPMLSVLARAITLGLGNRMFRN